MILGGGGGALPSFGPVGLPWVPPEQLIKMLVLRPTLPKIYEQSYQSRSGLDFKISLGFNRAGRRSKIKIFSE